MLLPKLDNWPEALSKEFEKEYFKNCISKIEADFFQGFKVFPSPENFLKAFEICDFEKVKVLILGQDPYFNIGQAQGLAFSVPDNFPLPPSLKNIFKELESDLGIKKENGNLESWGRQGVLLLNSILSVREGLPGSHKNIGWNFFTDFVIEFLSTHKKNMVFILWGNFAREKKKFINTKKHLILESPHPSPLSAYQGFWGSKPFSKTDNFLLKCDLQGIKW